MDEQPGLSDQYRRASPWPLFVALGIVFSEVGVFLGITALAVGGILLLAGSVVGILRESAYTETLWRPALGVGALFFVVGLLVRTLTGATTRGANIAIAGGLVLLAGLALAIFETGRL